MKAHCLCTGNLTVEGMKLYGQRAPPQNRSIPFGWALQKKSTDSKEETRQREVIQFQWVWSMFQTCSCHNSSRRNTTTYYRRVVKQCPWQKATFLLSQIGLRIVSRIVHTNGPLYVKQRAISFLSKRLNSTKSQSFVDFSVNEQHRQTVLYFCPWHDQWVKSVHVQPESISLIFMPI